MSSNPITVDVANDIARITLNRPENRNALNDPLVESLEEALRMAENDDEIGCVVLSGAGNVFCLAG